MPKRGLSRRRVIMLLLLGAGYLAVGGSLVSAAMARPAKWKGAHSSSAAKSVAEEGKTLKAGQFTWHPERSPKGAVAIIVSVPKQRAYVYRNGILIGVSTVSTDKKGHETPTSVFTVLEKAEEHYSSEFDDAAMPHMERLTWQGSRCMPASCRAIPRATAASGFPPNSPRTSTR